jgi:uncharacterized protein YukE
MEAELLETRGTLSRIEEEIGRVEEEVGRVQEALDKAAEQIAALGGPGEGVAVQYWMRETEQLRRKEEQLRQLELKLMDQHTAPGM